MSASRAKTASWLSLISGLGIILALVVSAGGALASTLAPPDGAGVLSESAGGLGADLWVGTPLATAQRLLAELPVASPSPARQRLTTRLLLSSAEPPIGDDGGFVLAALRVAKLAAMGDAAGAVKLVAAIPGAFSDATIARHWVEVQLVQTPDVLDCAEVAKLGPAFTALTIACQVAAKEAPAPTRTMPADPGVAELILAHAAGQSVSAEMLAAIRDPLRLALIGRAEASDPDIRLLAAERATAAGALTETDLAAAYATVRFAPAALARPLSAGETGARARALAYQATIRETAPAVRAELLRRAFELSGPGLGSAPPAEVPLTLLRKLPIDESTGWLAPVAIKALALRGHTEATALWLKAPHTPEESAALGRLWPLTALATEDGNAAGAAAWLDAALLSPDPARRANVADMVALLQAAGVTLPENARTRLNEAATATVLPPLGLWQAFQAASAAHRIGETVLTTLALYGDGGPSTMAAVVQAQIITGLRAVGLAAEARALAREAIAPLLD
ncbi:MAG: hypothetical protein WCF85_02205 [Rhodospirillaceae bacterium]